MFSNLPIKKEETLFGKIKAFFRKLFFKNAYETIIENDMENQIKEETKTNTENTKSSFQDSIKVETKNDFINDKKREDFLDEIEKNPSLLYELPVEKLEKLESYYKTSVEKHEEKLAKIKKAS